MTRAGKSPSELEEPRLHVRISEGRRGRLPEVADHVARKKRKPGEKRERGQSVLAKDRDFERHRRAHPPAPSRGAD